MTKKSDATRARILAAGVAEFAEHGVAGARVERVAATAACNKQLIYAYFGSKDGLADAVYAEMISALADAVPFRADDLAQYAVDLFDYYQANPAVQRLNGWFQLERTQQTEALPTRLSSVAGKVLALKEAQAEGKLTTRFSAEELLALVLRLAAVGHPGSPEAQASTPERMHEIVRGVVETIAGLP